MFHGTSLIILATPAALALDEWRYGRRRKRYKGGIIVSNSNKRNMNLQGLLTAHLVRAKCFLGVRMVVELLRTSLLYATMGQKSSFLRTGQRKTPFA
jgi:hypothetical protein